MKRGHGTRHELRRHCRDPQRLEQRVSTVGWLPGCDSASDTPVPCLVCDPFLGNGTGVPGPPRKAGTGSDAISSGAPSRG